MKYLFINGSPNPNGNTAALAAELLEGKNYKSLNLTDYIIGAYGQELPGDGLETVIAAMDEFSILLGPGIDGRKGMTATFDGLPLDTEPVNLKFLSVQPYDNGAVWLRYALH